jgi:RNA polymerase sigma-70 factor (ECF subfamily)
MTVAAIAAATGAKEGTVKSWLHRGRKELAALLTDPGAEAPAKAAKAPEADPDTMPIRIKRALPGPRSANRRASVKEDRS